MLDLSVQLLQDLEVVPERASAELRSMYAAAVEHLGLLSIDYCTIRDLVKLSGRSDPSLHLLLIAMFASMSEGSVCLKLTPESLKKKLEPITGPKTEAWARALISRANAGDELIRVENRNAPGLFDDPRDEYRPLIMAEEGGARYLYFQKYYVSERNLKRYLSELTAREAPLAEDRDKALKIVHEVLEEKSVRINGRAALLNEAQKLGVTLPLDRNFVLISGGPGTGKTFIVLNLVRVLVRMGIPVGKIKIAAPTGRAAQKLTEAILQGIASIAEREPLDLEIAGLQGTTIHRLLEYSPSRNDFIRNKYHRIDADAIIIDEASMIDLVLLEKLFEAVGGHARVVMLGDRNQLPSVEAGAVLAQLIPDEDGPAGALTRRVVLLSDSYRSEPRIRAAAREINNGNCGVIESIPEPDLHRGLPEDGIWRIAPGTTGEPYHKELHRLLRFWADHFYLTGKTESGSFRSLVEKAGARTMDPSDEELSACVRDIFSRLDEARILCPQKSGISGASGINSYLAGAMKQAFDPGGAGSFFSGAPVVITRNDYARELYNGDSGVILRGNDGRYYGLFRRVEGFIFLPVETLPPFELSYAITVHKSQGSEYRHVLIIISDGVNENLLTREILYTGITRAKKLAVIYSRAAILSKAIGNRIERQSGISLI
jgi:exodeoxyribonuclease V alpha subunit